MLVHVIRKNGAREVPRADPRKLFSFSFFLSFRFVSFRVSFLLFPSIPALSFSRPPFPSSPFLATPNVSALSVRPPPLYLPFSPVRVCACVRVYLSRVVISIPFPTPLPSFFIVAFETLSFAFRIPPAPTLCLSRFFSYSASISLRARKRAPLQSSSREPTR